MSRIVIPPTRVFRPDWLPSVLSTPTAGPSHSTAPMLPSTKASGSGGTRVDLPPLFHLPGPRAQGTGPGPLKVWGGIPLWICSASQTVQDPRTSQSPAPFIPFTPCFLYLLQRSFTIPHTKVGLEPTLCSRKTGGQPPRAGLQELLPPRRGGGAEADSPQPPRCSLLPRAPAITRYEGVFVPVKSTWGEHSVPQWVTSRRERLHAGRGDLTSWNPHQGRPR